MTVADLLEEKGIEKGIEQGIDIGIQKTAINALKKGCELSFVQEITGLSPEVLTDLKKKIQES